MDILDISNKEVININRICRFCADINTKLYPIFENRFDEKITSFIQGLQVLNNDGLPDMICALCKYKLCTAYDFKIQVLSIDRKLRDLLLNDYDILHLNNLLDEEPTENVENKNNDTILKDPCDIKTENNENNDSTEENLNQKNKNLNDTQVSEINNEVKLEKFSKSENRILKNIEISEVSKIVEERLKDESINTNNEIKIKRKMRKLSVNLTLKCPECGKNIKKHCFKDHMKTHTRVADRECPICGMMLITRAALYQHKKSAHSEKQPINCDQCGKNFATNSAFHVHYRTVHLQIKKYECELCSRCFALPKTLKHHMQVHTGDRPYVCQHCGKCLSSPFALKQHIRLHTDEKPYKCSDCDESFKQNVTLKLHYKRVHLGITPEQEKLTKDT